MLKRVRAAREGDDDGTKARTGAAKAAVTTATRTRSRIMILSVPGQCGYV